MRFASFLLICFLILLVTGWLDGMLRRMRVDKGIAAAFAVLLLALVKVSVPLGSVTLQPAFLLLLFVAGARVWRRSDLLVALAAAVIAGVADWLLYRLVPTFFEWGLLLALPQALFSALLLRRERASTFCCAAAPLVFSLLLSLDELLAFGESAMLLGGRLLTDMQVCGAMLSLLLREINRVCAVNDTARRQGMRIRVKNDT